MRPYIAVIVDSFRAAFTSRILWVALGTIYLFLAVIAPIGYREVFTTTIRWFDFSNGTRMKAMLAEGIAKESKTPVGMIARALPDEIQGNLRKVAEGEEVRIRLDLLADSLNALLDKDDWYDASIWKNTNRLRELRELDAKPRGELSDELKRRQARLRIESALPGVFENRSARSMALTYAGYDFPAVFQIDPTQFKLVLNHFVLRIIIDWVLGFVMIFLGILVTASIVPDMLQPGSLHLLLSKPISRPLLFIAKFIGGCAFVFVCVAQLIIGLWLISGFRLDIWNARLLLCIPVCVFLFAVFYSVSALAGLRWRSPILSIGLANAFGALCLIIGIAGGVSDGFITEPDRIEALAVDGDTIISATRGADLRRFDPLANRWIDLFPDDSGNGDRILAPTKLKDGRFVTARVRGGRMNMFGSGATSLLVLDPSADYKPTPSIELPTATSQLLSNSRGELMALNSSELMLASPEALQQALAATQTEDEQADAADDASEKSDTASEQSSVAWLPKLLKMMGGATDGFHSIVPKQISLLPPRSIAFTADGQSVFILASGKLVRLDRPDTAESTAKLSTNSDAEPTWKLAEQSDVEVGSKQVWIRMLGDEIVVLRSESEPSFYEQSLAPVKMSPDGSFDFKELKVADAVACPGTSSVALLTADGEVILITRESGSTYTMKPVDALSDVDTLHWDSEAKRLWISHHVDSVASINVETMSIEKSYKPTVEGWRLADRYIVTPLRTLTPQTGELGETIASIVSGESTMEFPMAPETAQTQRYNVWRPVITCASFIALMLTIGCVYFARADF
jgi:hypothetical protein